MKILFVGDVMGQPGRRAVAELVPRLRETLELGLVIANGENLAAGIGLTEPTAAELLRAGVDVITTGNHVFAKKEVYEYLESTDRVIRPANYPPGAPGRGRVVVPAADGTMVGVLNVLGRVFMEPLDCPFRVAQREVEGLTQLASVIIVDLHAEATSEKIAFARYFDGQVTAVIGTHTHVQTADEQILPGGTGFITDAGMTGPNDSVIGMSTKEVLSRFLTQMPARWHVPKADGTLRGVLLTINPATGKTQSIRRIIEPNPISS